ncbi:MAG: SurA N-terminal domain-containing protein [Candidatus Puniceispirillales bacterium]|jgi:peptidyl-prolyl cis-trans isomerase D|tara:strand:- start:708 stop:2573 length:1866 start_codon:yes stop_codon:yes gene_type:complete
MLRTLRNQTQSIFFKAFLVLLIIGFAAWGVGDLSGNSNQNSVLSVGKQKITSEEIINELNKVRYRMQQRPSINEAIKNGILNDIINKFEQEILINAEAKKLNLYVPLNIQTMAIRDEQAFKDPLGKFSQVRFLKSLNNAGLNEEKYLDMINTEAYFKQLSMPISLNKTYNTKIVKKLIEWQNEVREIDYFFLDKIKENKIKVPDANDLQVFYNEYKDLYKIPVTKNFKYIEIQPSDFKKKITVNDKKIKEIYESEITKYTSNEERSLYQVISQDIDKANAFIKKLKENDDFVKLAKDQFSLSKKDIDIGFVKKYELPKETKKQIFDGKTKDVIGPIKTKFGYAIYQLNTINPKKTTSYKDAYAEIKRELLNELSLELLYKDISSIEESIDQGDNLEEIVNSELLNGKFKVKNLDNFAQKGILYLSNGKIKNINNRKLIADNIWKITSNQISDVIELPKDTFMFVQLIKENKEYTPVFKEIRTDIYKKWVEKEQLIQTELKLKKIVKENKVKFNKLLNIERNQINLTNKIKDKLIINQIFKMKKNKINFIKLKNGVIAIKFINSKTKNYNLKEDTINQLNASLSESFFNDYSNNFIQILGNKHKIKRDYKSLENFISNLDLN